MADASSGSSGGSGNSGRSHRSNHRRSCNVSKGSSSHSPASNSVSSWARLNWPSTSDNSLGNGTEIYGSIDDDREMAKKAVAFVLNSTSKGVVSLCSEVSSILKAKRRVFYAEKCMQAWKGRSIKSRFTWMSNTKLSRLSVNAQEEHLSVAMQLHSLFMASII